VERLAAILDAGKSVQQQTRSFDASNDTTFAIRDKEEANDYRYFPDPDLAPFHLTETFINNIAAELPVLPNELQEKYQKELGLSQYDAHQLSEELATSNYFNSVTELTDNYKAAANWILGPIRQWLHEHHLSIEELTLVPEKLVELLKLVDTGKVNFSVCSSKIMPLLIQNSNSTALDIAESLNLLQVSDTSELEKWIQEVITKMPDKVTEYQKGKKGLIGLFVGEVKKLSKGKADPKIVTDLLEKALQK
jgi:aspartyl-tRNA(Asn)/glutamyl-tRNA(Gln) amidotransferase subunit B